MRQSVVTIWTGVLIAGSVFIPLGTHAQGFVPEQLGDYSIESVAQDLGGVVYRVKMAFTQKRADVMQAQDLHESARMALASHCDARINWLDQIEGKIENAQSVRDVMRIHQDVEAFVSQPVRPSMDTVVGSLFTRHQQNLDRSLLIAEKAMTTLGEQGIDDQILVDQFGRAEEAVAQAFASYEMAKQSADPAAWRVAKQDHYEAKEAIKRLFSELRTRQ